MPLSQNGIAETSSILDRERPGSWRLQCAIDIVGLPSVQHESQPNKFPFIAYSHLVGLFVWRISANTSSKCVLSSLKPPFPIQESHQDSTKHITVMSPHSSFLVIMGSLIMFFMVFIVLKSTYKKVIFIRLLTSHLHLHMLFDSKIAIDRK